MGRLAAGSLSLNANAYTISSAVYSFIQQGLRMQFQAQREEMSQEGLVLPRRRGSCADMGDATARDGHVLREQVPENSITNRLHMAI